jgi:hypothetical protein
VLKEQHIQHDRHSGVLSVPGESLIHALHRLEQRYVFLNCLLKERIFAVDLHDFHQSKVNRVSSEWVELVGNLILDSLLNL